MWLNCDMGESFGAWKMGMDEAVMPFIDQANIACGFHASDPLIMQKTVRLALQHNVMIGAHPSYPDLVGFGRRSMSCTPAEITAFIRYQYGALQAIARAEGGKVAYVKPHGALHNDMMKDEKVLRAVMAALASEPEPLPLMIMTTADNSNVKALAAEYGVTLWLEAFADRGYDAEGYLMSRSLPNAVHHDVDTIVRQALTLARGESILASSGSPLKLDAVTLCVHGDNPESIRAVQAIREGIDVLTTAE
ncbi:LamB/YcsF family protein [Pokkaliibacter plantistimulans]|uniref:LamB/YcsF family protein n=1 Tax=Proteobacteria bacterium 228 TaxID=2083153 RepID=A0A2S5KSY4_9PROT|nr:5-oxoprolinase subunit PxpA [Pokkaliibacter plantistimulans]PPC77782.1 LamB/YcsF family protein [Pokkaliibacter plantistimulans]